MNAILAAWGAMRVPFPAATQNRVNESVSRRKRWTPVFGLTRMMPAAVGTSVAALLVMVSVNAGILFQSQPALTASSAPSRAAARLQNSQRLKLYRINSGVYGHVAPYVQTQPRRGLFNLS
jgi:hypothetical protein